MVMLVNYEESPVGGYHELLYCRRRRFDGVARWHVDPIVVSSHDSVEGGRANWGFPKSHACFDVAAQDGDVTTMASDDDGRVFAEIEAAGFGPRLPVSSRFVPDKWLEFTQERDGQRFDFSAQVSCDVRLARARRMTLSAPFPSLDVGGVRLALHLPRFEIEFPRAQVRSCQT